MSFNAFSKSGFQISSAYAQSLRDRADATRDVEIDLGVGASGSSERIRIATSDGHRQAACDLINRMYAWRGYGNNHQVKSGPSYTTFSYMSGDRTVGTLTLAVDSEDGLAADSTFSGELNSFRRVPRARVCELTKFAFDTQGASKQMLASLFHVVFLYGRRRHACTDLFIEVNPRHVRFYEIMLAFKRVGSLKTNESVGAPSQLMHLRVADIAELINENAGQGDSAVSRSLYPFFLGATEETRIRSELSPLFNAADRMMTSTIEALEPPVSLKANAAPPNSA